MAPRSNAAPPAPAHGVWRRCSMSPVLSHLRRPRWRRGCGGAWCRCSMSAGGLQARALPLAEATCGAGCVAMGWLHFSGAAACRAWPASVLILWGLGLVLDGAGGLRRGIRPRSDRLSPLAERRGHLSAALRVVRDSRHVITAAGPAGKLATPARWVLCSETEPPAVAAALPWREDLRSWIGTGSTFVVNAIGEDSAPDPLHDRFRENLDALDCVRTRQVSAGGGVSCALGDARAVLVCRADSCMGAGDHVIVCGELLAGECVARPSDGDGSSGA